MFFTNSQYLQDYFAFLFAGEHNKTFVEIGAYHPTILSNSYWLETKKGWQGLCIEADPDRAELLKNNRKAKVLNFAISNKVGQVQFIRAGSLSGIKETLSKEELSRHIDSKKSNIEEINVPCRTFNNLKEFLPDPSITYLSIDVEGHELEVLQGIDFHKFDIKLATIESTGFHRKQVISIMKENGFILLHQYHCDCFFSSEKHLNSLGLMKRFFKNLNLRLMFLANDIFLIFSRISSKAKTTSNLK